MATIDRVINLRFLVIALIKQTGVKRWGAVIIKMAVRVNRKSLFHGLRY